MDDTLSDRLQRYLNNRLSPGETEELERMIAEDEGVRQLYGQLAESWLVDGADDDDTDAFDVFWSLQFPEGVQPGVALGAGQTVQGTAVRLDAQGGEAEPVPITLIPVEGSPPTFRLEGTGWPEDVELRGIVLARIASMGRAPWSFRVPAWRLGGATVKPGGAEARGKLDARSGLEARGEAALSLAAEDGRGVGWAARQSPSDSDAPPVGEDFRCQTYWQNRLLRIRATLPPGADTDFIWAEIRGIGPGGNHTLHRTVLRVERAAAGWTILRIPQLDLAEFGEVEFHLRSLEPEDTRSLHALPVEQVDALLAERHCRTLLSAKVEGGWEFSARWPSYQEALVDSSHGWLLRVKPQGEGGER